MPVGQDRTQHGSQATRAGRGDNHGPAGAANPRRAAGRRAASLPALLLGAALSAAALPAAPPAAAQATPPLASPPLATQPDDNPLVQRGVPAEATAENAVVARDRALASGQRIAYDRMASALGLPRGLSDGQIEALVTSLVIESERITPRGYAARITVNFNPQRVAAGRAPGGATPGAPLSGPAFGTPAPGPAATPAVATVEAVARYRSFPEWVELSRRLGAAPAVSRLEVVTISGEMARLRLALRSQPPEAAAELAQGGVLLGPAAMDARPGEGWRVGLAGAR